MKITCSGRLVHDHEVKKNESGPAQDRKVIADGWKKVGAAFAKIVPMLSRKSRR